ncbi:hypothetical protein BDV19DRAFT_212629 [Aspergillus venezuelensis]
MLKVRIKGGGGGELFRPSVLISPHCQAERDSPTPFNKHDSFQLEYIARIDGAAITNLRAAGLGDVLYTPGQNDYEARIALYWSLKSQLRPWTIIQLRNTRGVFKAVQAISRTSGCRFAVKRHALFDDGALRRCRLILIVEAI